jgi:hypothetical protein
MTASACARCQSSSAGTLDVGGLQLCQPCATLVQDWPYPQWLKLSLVGLLILLVFALFLGRRYFAAGKSLYRGEQLVEKREYAKAIPYLNFTLETAPNSDKAALLAAKAGILSGDLETASKALQGHNNGYFKDANKPEFQEVNGLWTNATAAMDKLERASKLADQDGHAAEAAALARRAQSDYPQLRNWPTVIAFFDADADYERKDYDGFLQLAQTTWDRDPSPHSAAMLASAFACKYAVTNDPAYRQQSLQFLAKAKELMSATKEGQEAYQEFEPRILKRLETREIISKSEYDRRYRGGNNTAKTN